MSPEIDKKQCFIIAITMKQQKKNLMIALLVLALIWSIIINLLQSAQVDRLMNQVEDLEYLQTVLTSHIDELEGNEDANEDF